MPTPRQLFRQAFPGPNYQCYVCRRETNWGTGIYVHHIDEDRSNNHPLNLAPCHSVCHKAFHVAKEGLSMTRTTHLQFMVSLEEKAIVKAAAKSQHLTTSEYIRQHVLPSDPEREARRLREAHRASQVDRAVAAAQTEPPESRTSPQDDLQKRIKAKMAQGKTSKLAEIEAREELGL